ncbi:MAG: phenylalanine--tRNA ligase subunit beta [Thermodesulfobacteriota bacterium]|nr:phenylalanine--tRNA ligase subunit beta [Thermodesulfobacteriota bacterium]
MKVSLSWLKQYIDVDMPASEMAHSLTMAGLEVEGIVDRFAYLTPVVVGRITRVTDHPNADRLKVCDVDDGQSTHSVVCGAPNVRENMLTPLARPGAVLGNGTAVKKGKIRGVASAGMLCSAAELGIGDDASGIMALDTGIAPGTPLNTALGLSDPVLEIDLTPNRPDCLSIIGVAREVAAFSGKPLRRPDIHVPETGKPVTDLSAVTIDAPDLCPRYTARAVLDITVGQSPHWLCERLLSVGLKPINNIVDITNFVMMETGQPLHAFDMDRLAENRIVVRRAGNDKTFTTLDGKERHLFADMLMICDAEKPVAVAGVMGGQNSEIFESTTRVLIESACFHPASIRKTAKALGMGSDASHRFERGVDPAGTVAAADRAAQLMAEIAGGKPAPGIIDNNPVPVQEKRMSLNADTINQRLGTDIPASRMARLLSTVEIPCENTGDQTLDLTVPAFRVDIDRQEDIIEEVARIWGYNNIPVTFPAIPVDVAPILPAFARRNRARDIMAGLGFAEAVNYSFISREACDCMGFATDDSRNNPVEILNPLTLDQSVMRTSLVPGLLTTIQLNAAQQIKDAQIFEIGRIFLKQPHAELPDEPEMIAAAWTGARHPRAWLSPTDTVDFYDIKGVVEALVKALSLPDVSFTALPPEECVYSKPGYTARIRAGNTDVGIVGAVADSLIAGFNLKQPVFIFELNLTVLGEMLIEDRQATPLSRFPAVARDMTLILPEAVEACEVVSMLETLNEELIETIRVTDVYQGEPVPTGKKSLSIRIVYRSHQGTLKDKFINRLHAGITDKIVNAFEAELPE